MTWDEYFLEMCNTVALNSKCLSRKIGTVMVRDKSVVSTGFNGPAKGVPHCDRRHYYDISLRLLLKKKGYINDLEKCPRQILGYKSGEGLEWCTAGHSERNTLIQAAKNGTRTEGCKLYMNCGIPCVPCLIEIINAGIKEIIVTDFDIYDKEPSVTEFLLQNSNLKVRDYQGETY